MNQRLIIITLIVILGLHFTNAKGPMKNVLFIVADDIGWSDLGVADPEILTPNINKLMKNGIILNNTYTYSVCTPSRNSILSGVYAEHTGLQHEVILPEQPIGLPLHYKLMPKYFKDYGYKTHMVGKWHIGFCNKSYTPVERGFDTFLGYFNAQEDYYSHDLPALIIFKGTLGLDYWNQTAGDSIQAVRDKNGTYSMFTFTERAIQILDAHDKKQPFFMYFSSQNVHLPIEVPVEYENLYPNVQNEDRRKYLGQISILDEAIGNLTDKLDQLGMLDNTLIVFTSDNGGATYGAGRNYPLRGGKLTAFEGGHKVRAFVNGPGIKPGVYNGMFHSIDWIPTILNAAISENIEISDIDGINQWPSIIQNLPSNRTEFVYNIDPLGQTACLFLKTNAIRVGDWKLIEGCPGIYDDWYPIPTVDYEFLNRYEGGIVSNFRLKPHHTATHETEMPTYGTFLFNIKDDPLEKNNLASSRPDILKLMREKLEHYKKSVVFPLNPPTLLPDPKANPNRWNGTWSPGWC